METVCKDKFKHVMKVFVFNGGGYILYTLSITICNTHCNDIILGPLGSNHGSLQKPPLLALGHRALRDLPRCTVRGSGEREGL